MDAEDVELIMDELSISRDRIDQLRDKIGFFTEEEFALTFGIKSRTAQDWRLSGKPYPPHLVVGRSVILPIETTREWMLDQLRGKSIEVVHRASPRRRRAG